MDSGREGGGWTLVVKNWYKAAFTGGLVPAICDPATNANGCNSFISQNSMGAPADAGTFLGYVYKLADIDIRNGIIGPGQNFDVMNDAKYSTPFTGNGLNYENSYLLGYTGFFQYSQITAASTTPVTFRSRRTDGMLAWQGELFCGTAGGFDTTAKGINCLNVNLLKGTNPQGGLGCNSSVFMGTGPGAASGLHIVAMFTSINADTEVSLCNGKQ
jgi:hypothetical protein